MAALALPLLLALNTIYFGRPNTGGRSTAAERAAEQAKDDAENQRREAENASKRANQAEKRAAEAAAAEGQERQRREEAEERAAEATAVEEQERDKRREAEKRAAEAAAAEEQERQKRKKTEEKAKHERRLWELGLEPDREITEEETRNAKLAVGYVVGQINIAVVGRQNEGKSSLVNSLRGIRPGHPHRAAVGEAETTKVAVAFKDETHTGVVWHDLPGGGTSNISAWGYYYDCKLYAYDKILLVHSSALSELDVKIVQLCMHMKKEYIVARTKADVHIRNCKRNKCHDSVENAREDYLRQVRDDTKNVTAMTNETEKLRLEFTDFVISEMGVLQIVNGDRPSNDPHEHVIDEERFVRQLGL